MIMMMTGREINLIRERGRVENCRLKIEIRENDEFKRCENTYKRDSRLMWALKGKGKGKGGDSKGSCRRRVNPAMPPMAD